MAEFYEWSLHNGVSWGTLVLSNVQRMALLGPAFGEPIEVGSFNDSTFLANNTLSTSFGPGNNVKFIDATNVEINGLPFLLSHTAFSQDALTLRIQFNNDTVTPTACVTSNSRFFVYDGITLSMGPAKLKFFAFEHYGTGIGKDTTSGSGRAWNQTYGINGSGNKLILQNQGSSVDHFFYLGISTQALASAAQTDAVGRFETDYL